MVNDDEEQEQKFCPRCNKNIPEDDAYTCGECENIFCVDCVMGLNNMKSNDGDKNLCKNCIDEEYPRQEKIVEKVVEKIIEVPKETIKIMGFSEPIL